MTFNEARTILLKQLSKVYDADEVKNIADIVLEHITGLTRLQQVSTSKNYLTCDQLDKIDSITDRLRKNEPVQYVLGEAWFAGMKFKVNKNVLIPRPETEELADWIVNEIEKRKSKIENRSISILDVGTGSGCIPITIKKKCPATSVSALDISSEAVSIAAGNAIELNAKIDFILMDFLDKESWIELGQFDFIVSNPPYIRQSEAATMHKRVKDFEPSLALFVPDNDALIFYKQLADFAKAHLKIGGGLFVEVNEALGKDVVNLFQSAGLVKIEIRKDMQGKERMVKGVLLTTDL